jgi:hypothetical protein
MNAHLDNMFAQTVADGWVEQGENGLIYIELFAYTLLNLGVKPGDYVKIRILTKDDLEAAHAQ